MLRGLRNILILIVVVAVIQSLLRSYGESKRDHAIAQAVEAGNAKLPMVIGGRIRAEKIEYANHAVRFYAVYLGDETISQPEKDAFAQGVKQVYCQGGMKAFSDAKVAIEYSIKTQLETVPVSLTPDECR